MSSMPYLDFDLLIQRIGNGYRAHVLTSPAGQASTDFGPPFLPLELENFLLRVGRTRRGTRRTDSPELEAAKAFGARLFDRAFGGEVGSALRRSLAEADRQGAGLRIRLRLTDTLDGRPLPRGGRDEGIGTRSMSVTKVTRSESRLIIKVTSVLGVRGNFYGTEGAAFGLSLSAAL